VKLRFFFTNFKNTLNSTIKKHVKNILKTIDYVLNCFKDMFFFTNTAYSYISEFLIDSSELINFNPINQIVNSFLWNLNDYNNRFFS